MNTLFATLLDYFDSIEIEGSNIFQINLPNIIIFTIGLIYILGSVFVIYLYDRQKKIAQEYKKSTTTKSKYKNLAARVAYLSKITKREKAIKELKSEKRLVERIKPLPKNQKKFIMHLPPFHFIPNLDWPGRRRG